MRLKNCYNIPMKIALGIIVTNEINFLKRHLPLLIPHFDGVFVCDGGSTDGSVEYLKTLNINLLQGDYGHWETWREDDHKNSVIIEAEKQGYDWILNLDADEIMFPEDIEELKRFMQGDNVFLMSPRIEFYGDTLHFKPQLYPDYQGRAIKLNQDFRWVKPIHSYFQKIGEPKSAGEMGHATIVVSAPIYHYGWAIGLDQRLKRYYPDAEVPAINEIPDIKIYYGKQPV